MSVESVADIMLERVHTFVLKFYGVTIKAIIETMAIIAIITCFSEKRNVTSKSHFGVIWNTPKPRLDRLLMMPVLSVLSTLTNMIKYGFSFVNHNLRVP